jgi:hypothetical protein
LHRGNYGRKPRGGLLQLAEEEHSIRYSFCCAKCRKRITPPSVRFLGRKVYQSGIVVVASVMRFGPTPEAVERLRELFGVSGRTLVRWRRWWQEVLGRSPFWQIHSAALMPPVELEQLPGALLERFVGEMGDRLVALLRFLSPTTTRTARNAMPV